MDAHPRLRLRLRRVCVRPAAPSVASTDAVARMHGSPPATQTDSDATVAAAPPQRPTSARPRSRLFLSSSPFSWLLLLLLLLALTLLTFAPTADAQLELCSWSSKCSGCRTTNLFISGGCGWCALSNKCLAGSASGADSLAACSASNFVWFYNPGNSFSSNDACPTTPWLAFGPEGAYVPAAFVTPATSGTAVPTAYRMVLPAGAWTSGALGLSLRFQGRSTGDYVVSRVSLALREPGGMNAQEASWIRITFGATAWADGVSVAVSSLRQTNPVPFCVPPGAAASDLIVTFLSTMGGANAPVVLSNRTIVPALTWSSGANAADAAADWRWDGLSSSTSFTPTFLTDVAMYGVHSVMAAQTPSSCAAPSITVVAPTVVPIGVAVTLTLTGSFGAAASDLHNVVYGRAPFGYTSGYEGPCATTTWVSSTQVLCALRPGGVAAAGAYAFAVGAVGQTATSGAVTFVAQGPPAIASVLPRLLAPSSVAADTAARTLTVTGSLFGRVASDLVSVRYGSTETAFTPCASFSWVNSGSVRCVLPVGLSSKQAYTIQVVVAFQSSAGGPFPPSAYNAAAATAFWIDCGLASECLGCGSAEGCGWCRTASGGSCRSGTFRGPLPLGWVGLSGSADGCSARGELWLQPSAPLSGACGSCGMYCGECVADARCGYCKPSSLCMALASSSTCPAPTSNFATTPGATGCAAAGFLVLGFPAAIGTGVSSDLVTLTLRPGVASAGVVVQVSWSGSVSGSLGSTSLDFSAAASRSFEFLAPAAAQTLTVSFTLSGASAPSYSAPSPLTAAVVPAGTLSLAGLPLPGVFYAQRWSSGLSVYLDALPPNGVVVRVLTAVDGLPWVNLTSAATITFRHDHPAGAGAGGAVAFAVLAPHYACTVTLSFELSGPDRHLYRLPPPGAMIVTQPVRMQLGGGPPGGQLYADQSWLDKLTLDPTAPAADGEVTVQWGVVSSAGGGAFDASFLSSYAHTVPAGLSTPLLLSIRAPVLAPQTLTVSFVLSGPGEAHFYPPLPLVVTVLPRARLLPVLAVRPGGRNSTLYAEEESTLSLALSEPPGALTIVPGEGVTVTLAGAGFLLSPSAVYFAPGAVGPLLVSVRAPPTAQQDLLLALNITGGDRAHYYPPEALVLRILPRAVVAPPALPASLYANEAMSAVAVVLPEPPAGAGVVLTAHVYLGGAPVPRESYALTFPGGDVSTRDLVGLVAPSSAPSVLLLSFQMSGDDSAHYQSPPNASIAVLAQAWVTFETTLPASMYHNEMRGPLLVTVSELPNTGTTASLNVSLHAGDVAAPVLAWYLLTYPAAADTARPDRANFGMVAPPSGTEVTLAFAWTGPDRAHYAAPAPHRVVLVAQATLALLDQPPAVLYASELVPLRFQLSEPPNAATNLELTLSASGGAALSPSNVATFSAPATLVVLTLAAPSSVAAGGGSVVVSAASLGGTDYAHYRWLSPALPFTAELRPRHAVNVSALPTFLFAGQVFLVEVRPTFGVAFDELVVLASLSGAGFDAGLLTLDAATLTFEADELGPDPTLPPPAQFFSLTVAPVLSSITSATLSLALDASSPAFREFLPLGGAGGPQAVELRPRGLVLLDLRESSVAVNDTVAMEVALSQAPFHPSDANVHVLLRFSASDGATVVPSCAVFTPANFSVAVAVTLTAPSTPEVDVVFAISLELVPSTAGAPGVQYEPHPGAVLRVVGVGTALLGGAMLPSLPLRALRAGTLLTNLSIVPSLAPDVMVAFDIVLLSDPWDGSAPADLSGLVVPGSFEFPASSWWTRRLFSLQAPAEAQRLNMSIVPRGPDAGAFVTLELPLLVRGYSALACSSASCGAGAVPWASSSPDIGGTKYLNYTLTLRGMPALPGLYLAITAECHAASAGCTMAVPVSPASGVLPAPSAADLADGVAYTFALELPIVPGGRTGQRNVLQLTPGGPGAHLLEPPAPLVVAMNAQYTWRITAPPGQAGFIYVGQVLPGFGLAPLGWIDESPPGSGVATVFVELGSGDGEALQLAPSSHSFGDVSAASGAQGSRSFVVTAPDRLATGLAWGPAHAVSVTLALRATNPGPGSDAWRAVLPPPLLLELRPQANITVLAPEWVLVGSVGQNITVSIGAGDAPNPGLFLTLQHSCDTATPSPASLVWPGDALATTLTFAAPLWRTDLRCSFSLGGTDAAHYAVPAPVKIRVLEVVSFTLTASRGVLYSHQAGAQVLQLAPSSWTPVSAILRGSCLYGTINGQDVYEYKLWAGHSSVDPWVYTPPSSWSGVPPAGMEERCTVNITQVEVDVPQLAPPQLVASFVLAPTGLVQLAEPLVGTVSFATQAGPGSPPARPAFRIGESFALHFNASAAPRTPGPQGGVVLRLATSASSGSFALNSSVLNFTSDDWSDRRSVLVTLGTQVGRFAIQLSLDGPDRDGFLLANFSSSASSSPGSFEFDVVGRVEVRFSSMLAASAWGLSADGAGTLVSGSASPPCDVVVFGSSAPAPAPFSSSVRVALDTLPAASAFQPAGGLLDFASAGAGVSAAQFRLTAAVPHSSGLHNFTLRASLQPADAPYELVLLSAGPPPPPVPGGLLAKREDVASFRVASRASLLFDWVPGALFPRAVNSTTLRVSAPPLGSVTLIGRATAPQAGGGVVLLGASAFTFTPSAPGPHVVVYQASGGGAFPPGSSNITWEVVGSPLDVAVFSPGPAGWTPWVVARSFEFLALPAGTVRVGTGAALFAVRPSVLAPSSPLQKGVTLRAHLVPVSSGGGASMALTLSLAAWTAANASALYAPWFAAPSAACTLNLSFSLEGDGGDDGPSFTLPPPTQIRVLAYALPSLPVNQTLYARASSPAINLTIIGWDRGSIGEEVSFAVSLVGGGQVVPAVLSFAPGAGGAGNSSGGAVFTAPATTVPSVVVLSFTCVGASARCALVSPPPPLRFAILPRAYLAVQPVVPAFVYPGATFSVAFQPSQAPLAPGGLVFGLNCTATAGGGGLLNGTVSFPAGSAAPQALQYASARTQRPGAINCTAVLSGPAASQFETPAVVRVAILSPAPFLLTGALASTAAPGSPPLLVSPGINTTFTVRPSEQPRAAVMLQIAALRGKLSLANLTFTPLNWSVPVGVTFTAPATLGLLNISFGVSGDDALHYQAPSELRLNVTGCAADRWGPVCAPCACVQGACAAGVGGDGSCACRAGWEGTRCDRCAAGFFGGACAACPVCGLHGSCSQGLGGDGSCACDPGWTGLRCDRCAPGFFGPACSSCPPCGPSGHGTCADGVDGDGACLCEDGWYGSQCDTYSPGFFPLSTTSTGQENALVVVTFNGTVVSGAGYAVRVLSLPARGTLWQTRDGAAPTFQIASVPTVVADVRGRVLYRPPADQSSQGSAPLASFSFTVQDALHGVARATATAHLVVLHVNRAPVLTAPATLAVPQGALSPLEGVSVFDVDAAAGWVLLRLSVGVGLLRLSAASIASALPHGQVLQPPVSRSTLEASGLANATLVLNATVPELAAALLALRYAPPEEFVGSTSLLISASDQGNSGVGPAAGLSTSAAVEVIVERVNQPIRFNASMQRAIAAREDEPLFLGLLPAGAGAGVGLSLSDRDAYFGDCELNISVVVGSVYLRAEALAGEEVELSAPRASPGAPLRARGPLAALNRLLASLWYLSGVHQFGPDVVTLSASDLGNTGRGGATTAETSVAVEVAFADAAPVPTPAEYLVPLPGGRVSFRLGATDFHLAPEDLRYNVTTLPAPWCGTLYHHDERAPSRRGLPLTTAPLALQDPLARLWFLSSPKATGTGTGGSSSCAMAFRVSKPSGTASAGAALVRFVLGPAGNAAPYAPDQDLVVFPGRALLVQLGSGDAASASGASRDQGGDALVYYLTALPDPGAGSLFQYDADAAAAEALGDSDASAGLGAAIASAGVQVSDALGRVLFLPQANATVAAAGDLFATFAYAADDGLRWSHSPGFVQLRMHPPIIPLAASFNVTANQDSDVLLTFFPADAQANLLPRLDAVVVRSLPARGALFTVGPDGFRGVAVGVGTRVGAFAAASADATGPSAAASKVQLLFAPEMYTHGHSYASFAYTCFAASSSGVGSLGPSLPSDPSSPGLVTIHLAAIPHAPVAAGVSVANFSRSVVVRLNGTSIDEGVDGSEYTAAIKVFPARGLLTQYPAGAFGPDGAVTDPLLRVVYTPDMGGGGDGDEADSIYYAQFLYTVSLRRMNSFPARVALYVGAAQIGPVAPPLRAEVAEGSTSTLLLPGYDPKRGGVVATVLSLPSAASSAVLRQMGGQLLLPGSLVLDPQLRLSLSLPPRGFGPGMVSFSYRVSDSEGLLSAAGVVLVDVYHVPLPPVPLSAVVRGMRDLPVAVVLGGTSTEVGGVIRANLTSIPSVGTVHRCIPGSASGDELGAAITAAELPLLLSSECPSLAGAPVVWYAPPALAYSPADSLGAPAPLGSFRFGVHDGTLPSLASQEARVDVVVLPRVYPPTVQGQVVRTREREEGSRGLVLVQLEGSDLDGHPCVAVLTSLPANGSIYLLDERLQPSSRPVSPLQLPLVVSDPLGTAAAAVGGVEVHRVFYEPDAYFHGSSDSFTFLYRKDVEGRTYFSEPAAVALQVSHEQFAPRPWNASVAVRQSVASLFQLPVYDRSGATEGRGEVVLRVTSFPERGALYNVPANFTAEMARPFLDSGALAVDGAAPAPGSGDAPRRRLMQSSSASTIADQSRVSIPFPLGTALRETSSDAPDDSVIGGSQVTHPDGLVAFVPGFREFGEPGNAWLYAQFRWTAANAHAAARGEGLVRVRLQQEYERPALVPLRAVVETQENQAVVLGFGVVVDALSSLVALSVAVAPAHGTLCAFLDPALSISSTGRSNTPTADRPCGPGFGAQLGTGAQVFDEGLRVVYMPDRYYFGPDRFALQARDSKGGMSPLLDASLQRITVLSVNQAPLVSDTTLAINPRTERVRFNLSAWDPDPEDPPQALRYFVLRPPAIGVLHVQAFLDEHGGDGDSTTPVALRARSSEEIAAGVAALHSFPLRVSRESLWFDAAGAGASFPYAQVHFAVLDTAGHNSSATVQLVVECDVGRTFPHVWHGGTGGPLCLACPAGASCSDSGAALPSSLGGFWQSEYRQLNQPVFVPCTPASACISTPFIETPLAENAAACAKGYSSRMCGRCASGFYSQGGECQACASTSSTFVAVAIFGVPVVVVLCFLLWLARRLELDMTFISVSVNFFQTVATFKSFALHWPVSSSSMFAALSVANINTDIFSVECSLPAVSWFEKWCFMMLLPLVMLVLLLGGCVLLAVGQAMADTWRERQQTKGMLRGFLSALGRRWAPNHDRFVFYYFSFLQVIFLPLTQKALGLITCRELADGTSILVAAPSIRCDSAWWHGVRGWGYGCTVAYAAGIPLLFGWTMFRWRPPQHAWRCAGVFWCPHSSSSLHKARRKHLWDSVVSGQGEYDTAQAALRWRRQFMALVKPFREQHYFWGMVIVSRSLTVSIVAACMSSLPLWQASICLAFLTTNLAGQVYARPFRQGSGLNQLEIAAVSTQILLLFLGLGFYSSEVSAAQSGREGGSKYPAFHAFLAGCMSAAVALCGAFMARLFAIQLVEKFPRRLAWLRRILRWLDPSSCSGGGGERVSRKHVQPIRDKGVAGPEAKLLPTNSTSDSTELGEGGSTNTGTDTDAAPRAVYGPWFKAPRSAGLFRRRRPPFDHEDFGPGSGGGLQRQRTGPGSGPGPLLREWSGSSSGCDRRDSSIGTESDTNSSPGASTTAATQVLRQKSRARRRTAMLLSAGGAVLWRAIVRRIILCRRLSEPYRPVAPSRRPTVLTVDVCGAGGGGGGTATECTTASEGNAGRLAEVDDEDGGDMDELPLMVIPPASVQLGPASAPPPQMVPINPGRASGPSLSERVNSLADELFAIRVTPSSPYQAAAASSPPVPGVLSQSPPHPPQVLPPVVRLRVAGPGSESRTPPAGRARGHSKSKSLSQSMSPSSPAEANSAGGSHRRRAGSPSMSPHHANKFYAGGARSSSPLRPYTPEMSVHEFPKSLRSGSPVLLHMQPKPKNKSKRTGLEQHRPSLLVMSAPPQGRAQQLQQQRAGSTLVSMDNSPATSEPWNNVQAHPSTAPGSTFPSDAQAPTLLPGGVVASNVGPSSAQERTMWQLPADQLASVAVSAPPSPPPSDSPRALRAHALKMRAVTSPPSPTAFAFNAAPTSSPDRRTAFRVIDRADRNMIEPEWNQFSPPPVLSKATTSDSATAPSVSPLVSSRMIGNGSRLAPHKLSPQQPQAPFAIRGHAPLLVSSPPSALPSPTIPPLHPASVKPRATAAVADLGSLVLQPSAKWSDECDGESVGLGSASALSQSRVRRSPFQVAVSGDSGPAADAGSSVGGDDAPAEMQSRTRAHQRVFSMPEVVAIKDSPPVGALMPTSTAFVDRASPSGVSVQSRPARHGRRSQGPSPVMTEAAAAGGGGGGGGGGIIHGTPPTPVRMLFTQLSPSSSSPALRSPAHIRPPVQRTQSMAPHVLFDPLQSQSAAAAAAGAGSRRPSLQAAGIVRPSPKPAIAHALSLTSTPSQQQPPSALAAPQTKLPSRSQSPYR